MSDLVLDASVAMCWLFEDQATAYTDSILDRLAGGQQARAPAIWPFEIGNVLVVAERRKLITPAQSAAFLAATSELPIRTAHNGVDRAVREVFEIARRYRLSVYDASYLELAMRESLALATVDEPLRAAARAARVQLA